VTPGFVGNPDFKLADQFLLWRGDSSPGLTSYNTYFLLNTPGFTGWIKHGDVFRNSQDASPVFIRDQSVIVDSKAGFPTWTMPAPWSSDP
jgi:hypothetical protein